MTLFEEIIEIFFEKTSPVDISLISPKSYLKKYREQLSEVYFDDIIIATNYTNIEKELEQYKFFSDRSHIDLWCKIFQKNISYLENSWWYWSLNDFCITGVPMHWTRYFFRWFDHIYFIVKILWKKWYNVKKIINTRFTWYQSKLRKEGRLRNRENAYFIRKLQKIPEKIILIDDVVSTASSVNSCAKILKKSWAKTVIVLALASNL